jgi:hypothetical protein
MNPMSERYNMSVVLEYFSEYFYVREEVWGTHCTGKKLRVDALLKPRDCTLWRDGRNALIGMEFKSGDVGGHKQITQAMDYTHVDWHLKHGRRQRCMIFCFPAAWRTWDRSFDIERICGRFGVGEVIWDGEPYLKMSGETFWRTGLYTSGNYNRMSTIPKAGSR